MTDLEERIITFVAEQAGVKRERVRLSSDLEGDFGMAGDDGLDFFIEFGRAFQVDPADIDKRWNQHFYPEGSGPRVCGIAAIAAILVVAPLHQAVRWLRELVLIIALTVAFALAYSLLFVKNKSPITVQDLVNSAASGKWI